jgi:23S rRNA (uracil1939-C5)-methyltransferase
MGRKQDKDRIYESVAITEYGAEGKALGHIDEKVVFVPLAAPGDVVDIRITKHRSGYYEGVITNFRQKSALRRLPRCAHFGVCGGCKWQHIPYEEQLLLKENQVRQQLQRIGKIDASQMLPILGAHDEFYYRNKLEFAFTCNKWLSDDEVKNIDRQYDRRGVGFHVPGRFDRVLDIDNCHLQSSLSDEIRNDVKRISKENNITFFDLRQQTGWLRNLTIRNSSQGEWMVLLSVRDEKPDWLQLLFDGLISKFPQVNSWLYVINPKGNDTIYDLDVQVYKGCDFLMESLLGLKFKVGVKSFFQTHHAQAEELFSAALEMADILQGQTVYDLYCGTGTLSLLAASRGAKVAGIESVAEAVAAAQENALLNNLDNVHFETGDMKDLFNRDFISRYGKPDIVITDPPRAGMHEAVVQRLLMLAAPVIIYVSCNPATQARDIALLSEKYSVESIQPVDMFPQTHHVENIIKLKLK